MSERAERIFHEALGIDPRQRIAAIDAQCEGETELRDEVLTLLAEADAAEKFFQRLDDAVFSSASPSGDESAYSDSSDPDFRAGESVGHYRIESLIGFGGMGTVYRAHDMRLDRDVALKFLPTHLSADPDEQARLLAEARAAAVVDHPNVCTVHEVGETDDGRLFIAMPCYSGETLKERLRAGALPANEAVAIGVQIARGLAAAHSHDIIHRDVKPGNVILLPDRSVRLVDFGLAMVMHARLISSGITPGTVAYMSPEQIRGQALDSSTDLWSLGVVLYEMLAGARPFRGPHRRDVIHAIFHEEPIPIAQRCPGIDPALALIVERLLEKDPAMRYKTASGVATELENVLHLGPAASRPSFVRKHRALVAAGIIVLLALAGGLSWRSLRGATAFQSSASSWFKRPSTRNIAAYELYQRGNDPALFRSDSGVRVAASYLRQALALDPNYGDAYAGLARVHTRPGNAVDPGLSRRERLALAEQEAMRAVSIDESSAEAHSALGMVRRNIYQFESAEGEYLRAIELEPENPRHYEWLSALHVARGRSARGLIEAKRAMQLDPLSPTAMAEVANSLLAQDRCDEALVLLEKLASLRPRLLRAGIIAAQCYARKQMWPEALAEAQRNLADGGPRARAVIGYVLARSGRTDEARRLIASLLSSQGTTANSFDVAIVYSALGDSDNALRWLDRAIDDRSLGFEWLPGILDDFRRHRHFSRYHQQLGLEFDRPGI